MPSQAHFWSRVANSYESEFIDPYRSDVRNPLLPALRCLKKRGAQSVADLGCGTGPLLPFLVKHFPTIWAVDFADAMLARARTRCPASAPITFLQCNLTDLGQLVGQLDVAVASNSLVLPNIADLDESLRQIRLCLKPGGSLLAILPAMDAVHYYTMLLVERALRAGKTWEAARKSAATHGEHEFYDFAFSEFRFKGLEQHFWQPYEIRHRFRRAGFGGFRVARVLLSWEQFTCGQELAQEKPLWDWFVWARVPVA